MGTINELAEERWVDGDDDALFSEAPDYEPEGEDE